MPPMGAALGKRRRRRGRRQLRDVALGLCARFGPGAARGKAKFDDLCAACHGADGKGNQALGAPNLADKVWLYGGTVPAIMQTINNGRGSAA